MVIQGVSHSKCRASRVHGQAAFTPRVDETAERVGSVVARLVWKSEMRTLPVGWLHASLRPTTAATGGMRHGRAHQEWRAVGWRPGRVVGELITRPCGGRSRWQASRSWASSPCSPTARSNTTVGSRDVCCGQHPYLKALRCQVLSCSASLLAAFRDTDAQRPHLRCPESLLFKQWSREGRKLRSDLGRWAGGSRLTR
jgi:hypothetical protein